MGKEFERIIKIIPLLKTNNAGWLSRPDFLKIFINETKTSVPTFNNFILFCKSFGIVSEHNYNQGYCINKEKFKEFQKDYLDSKK